MAREQIPGATDAARASPSAGSIKSDRVILPQLALVGFTLENAPIQLEVRDKKTDAASGAVLRFGILK
ncbi:MAG: hypothetical protein U0V87_15660 [Acidobacteriota bacterium]